MVVRVGFVTHLLWDRYGPFWSSLATSAGAEAVWPEPEAVTARLADPRVTVAPGLAARLAVAACLALEDVDLVVVPRLNPELPTGPGAGQDPWVADLPAMLRHSVPGLPAIWPVDADLARPLETNAIGFIRRLSTDPGRVRRTWARHRAEAHPPRRHAARLSRAPAGEPVLAVVGPPWWITPALLELVVRPADRVWSAHDLDPADLRAEGRRIGPTWVDSDAEALGAVRRFTRSAGVGGLRMVIDGAAGSEAWLARRAAELAQQRLEIVDLRDVAEPAALLAALLRSSG